MNATPLGFSWSSSALQLPAPAYTAKKNVFMVRKLLAQYVYDIVHLEGNPLSFTEVQAVVFGCSVGERRMSDLVQILNQQSCLDFLLDTVTAAQNWQWSLELACAFHARLARDEAREWGLLRSGHGRISGTDHLPPAASDLADLYQHGMHYLQMLPPFEGALAYFFWAARQQFFEDGNKRCARAMMNFSLLRHGYYYLSIPAERAEEFDRMMARFYESRDASEGMRWLGACYVDWE